jgi:hypothetical protein
LVLAADDLAAPTCRAEAGAAAADLLAAVRWCWLVVRDREAIRSPSGFHPVSIAMASVERVAPCSDDVCKEATIGAPTFRGS